MVNFAEFALAPESNRGLDAKRLWMCPPQSLYFRLIPGSRTFSKSYVQYRTVLLVVVKMSRRGIRIKSTKLVFTTGNSHCDNHNAPDGFFSTVQVDGVLCSGYNVYQTYQTGDAK